MTDDISACVSLLFSPPRDRQSACSVSLVSRPEQMGINDRACSQAYLYACMCMCKCMSMSNEYEY